MLKQSKITEFLLAPKPREVLAEPEPPIRMERENPLYFLESPDSPPPPMEELEEEWERRPYSFNAVNVDEDETEEVEYVGENKWEIVVKDDGKTVLNSQHLNKIILI